MNSNGIVLNVIISYDGCDWPIGMKIYYGMSYNDYITWKLKCQLEWNGIMGLPFLPPLWLVNWNGNVLWIISSYHDCDWSIGMEMYYG